MTGGNVFFQGAEDLEDLAQQHPGGVKLLYLGIASYLKEFVPFV